MDEKLEQEQQEKTKEKVVMKNQEYGKHLRTQAGKNWAEGGFWMRLWMIVLSVIVGGGIITMTVMLFLKEYIVMIILFCVLFVFVWLVILTAKLVEKAHLQRYRMNLNIPAKTGVVLSCTLSTEIANMKRVRNRVKEVELVSAVYRLKVQTDEKVITTYSYKYYEKGEKVSLRQHEAFKWIYIIEE